MKHEFKMSRTRLTGYCTCGRFWIESEGDTTSYKFEDKAQAAFSAHVAKRESAAV